MFPLQFGVPGAMELFVILLIAIIVFGVPVVLIAGGLYLYRRTQTDRPASEEIEALRAEVERLREEIDRLNEGEEESGFEREEE